MGPLLTDVRYAARRLARAPGFTLAAVAILAVGIGANTAVFALVDAALFRPSPFARPEEVVNLYQHSDDGFPSSSAYPAYRDMAALTDVFASVGAVSPANPSFEPVRLETAAGPRELVAAFATASYLPTLGLEPSRGRWFDQAHDAPGAGAFAVLGHRAWLSLFGGDPDVVGRTLRMNGQPVTVLGVGPASFNGPMGAVVTDVWLSISSTYLSGPFRVENLEDRSSHWYDVTARLAPGVTVERARAAMDALALRMGEADPEIDRGRGITLLTMGEVRVDPRVDGMLERAGFGLLAVVALVLILACSNLANLILVRGVGRSPEMAVRRALGASGGGVVRLFLVEALLLVALGGAAGLALARAAMALAPLVRLPIGASFDVALDARVGGFCFLLTLAAGTVFGLAPALRSARLDLASSMRDETRSASSGRTLGLARRTLVGVQVAVSLVLVAGAGLLVRSLAEARAVDPGFEPVRLALLGTDLAQGGVPADEVPAVRDELLARVRALPGVTSVGLTTRLPAAPGASTTTVVEGYEPGAGTGAIELAFAFVSRDYFATLGLPLVAGRTFVPDDFTAADPVIVVNEAAAGRFWGGDAVGRRIRPQTQVDAWRTVVGVVGDAKVASVREAPTPMYFVPAERGGSPVFTIVVRTERDPAALLGPLRAALRESGDALPLARLGTMEDHLGAGLAGSRAVASFMDGFSLLALLLASLGVYAMVSFSVASRAGEMGVRVAMGAPRARLVGMVVGESLVPVALGLTAGVIATLAAAPALGGFLFGVDARDPVTLAGAVALLVGVAVVASWLPAWRASRTDPVQALRAR